MVFSSTGYTNEKLLTEMVCMSSVCCLRGHVGIKINDEVDPFFCIHKGLRQVDPLSLFFLYSRGYVVDTLFNSEGT
jgi:hypothetical protein